MNKKQTKIQESLRFELSNWIIISCSNAFVGYYYADANF